MIIQDINVLTLLSIACYGIILVVVIIIYKAFRFKFERFFQALNPFITHERFCNISERLDKIEMEQESNNFLLKKLINKNKKLKKKKRK